MNAELSQSTSLSLDAMKPKPTDRALFVGQTGSGKTTLARQLLKFRVFKVLVDFKGTLHWPEYRVHTSLAGLVKAREPGLIYRPSYEESRNEVVQEQFWEWVYRRRNTTVYVDETAAITNGDQFPHYFGACLMRGRELGIEMWCATQRPMRIPQVVLSESEHVYAFRLRLPQDRARVEALTGIDQDRIHALPKHDFLYAPQDGSVMGPFRLDLGRAA